MSTNSFRKIYIDFTKPKNKRLPIFSYGIRFVEGTEYSHVRLRWVNTTGREVIYEASGSQVRFIGTLAQESNQVEIVKSYELDLTSQEYRALIDMCMKYAGVDYGVKQIIGILMTYICKLDKNPYSTGQYSQVCSELVGLFLWQVKGIEPHFNLDVGGPKRIDEMLLMACKARSDVRFCITPRS